MSSGEWGYSIISRLMQGGSSGTGAMDGLKGLDAALEKFDLVRQVIVLCFGAAGFVIWAQVSLPSLFFLSASTDPHRCYANFERPAAYISRIAELGSASCVLPSVTRRCCP